MRKPTDAVKIQGGGLESLLGKQVLLFCLNYIYAGKLVGIDNGFLQLEKPSIVYETGKFSEPGYADVQLLHAPVWYVQRGAIESFGCGK